MNEPVIVFSPRAKKRLEEIAEYLYKQHLSNEFVIGYLNDFESWLNSILSQFPESGTPMPEYGKDIRRVVYKRYSFLYRVKGNVIEILTIYRKNLP